MRLLTLDNSSLVPMWCDHRRTRGRAHLRRSSHAADEKIITLSNRGRARISNNRHKVCRTVPERHNIFDNPFSPFAKQIAPDNRVFNLEKRAEQAETALHAARRDLAAERERNGMAAEVDVEAARRKEQKRIHAHYVGSRLSADAGRCLHVCSQDPNASGRGNRDYGGVVEGIAGSRNKIVGGSNHLERKNAPWRGCCSRHGRPQDLRENDDQESILAAGRQARGEPAK